MHAIWIVVLALATRIGICYGALLYQSCDRTSDCPSNASCKPRDCEGWICYCDRFYIRRENNRECIKAANFSENCLATSARCSGMFSMCNPTTQRCECIMGYELNDDGAKCKSVGEVLLNDACNATRPCSLQEQTCSDGVCVCRKGLREFTSEENVAYIPNKYKECIDELYSLGRCKSSPSTSIETSTAQYVTEEYVHETTSDTLGDMLDSSSDSIWITSSTTEWSAVMTDSLTTSAMYTPPEETGERIEASTKQYVTEEYDYERVSSIIVSSSNFLRIASSNEEWAAGMSDSPTTSVMYKQSEEKIEASTTQDVTEEFDYVLLSDIADSSITEEWSAVTADSMTTPVIYTSLEQTGGTIEASTTHYAMEEYDYDLFSDGSSDFLRVSSSTEEWFAVMSDSLAMSVIHHPPNATGETAYHPNKMRIPEELLIIPGVISLLLLIVGITLIIVFGCQRRMSYNLSHPSLADKIRYAGNLEESLDFYYSTVPRSHRKDDQNPHRPVDGHSDIPREDNYVSENYGISNAGVSRMNEEYRESRNYGFRDEYELYDRNSEY